MLPETRTEGNDLAIPKFALETGDIEGFMEELKVFHDRSRGKTSFITW